MAIIGAGPIGIETAVGLKRAGAQAFHFEAGDLGSTMGWWAPGTRFFSSPERIAIADVPLLVEHQEKATREQYRQYLRQVVEQHQLSIKTFERVVDIARKAEDGSFVLTTMPSTHGVGSPMARRIGSDADNELKKQYQVEKIVLAIGNMHLPRMVEVPGEDLPHVSHYLEDPHKYYDKRVLIVGGRNSAVEAAIRLYRAGAKVTLCQRKSQLERKRIKYWLLPELEWLIKQGFVEFVPGAHLKSIDRKQVEVRVDDKQGTASQMIEADFVLLLTGYVQDTSLFSMLDIELETLENKPVFDAQTMETTTPGVFVAGTAIGGSAVRTRVFIENAHEHVEKIVRAITGKTITVRAPVAFEGNEES